MSRKTFTAAPKPRQPSIEAIDAYERGGVGHDHQHEEVTSGSAPAAKTKRLSLDLPASTHTRFKTACSANGRKMVSEIQNFIERRITELEIEAGITRK